MWAHDHDLPLIDIKRKENKEEEGLRDRLLVSVNKEQPTKRDVLHLKTTKRLPYLKNIVVIDKASRETLDGALGKLYTYTQSNKRVVEC